MALIFDIETIADLTPSNRDAIAHLASGREQTPEHYGALCPPLARVACIAWYDTCLSQLGASFDAQFLEGAAPASLTVSHTMAPDPTGSLPCVLEACDGEARVLESFGARLETVTGTADGQLVTFNGRGFDLAVLMHRSVRHGVVRGRTLLLKALGENRYRPLLHLDLMDALTFYGATTRWPLAAFALGYGFASPKEEMDGSQVGAAIVTGRILDVVRYCAGDVLATAAVYGKVREIEGWLSPAKP